MKVLLDTNFALLPIQQRLDVFSESEKLVNDDTMTFAVLSGTIQELKHLAAKPGKIGLQARGTLALLEEKKVKITPSKLKVDDATVASDADAVCTNDKELGRRLRRAGKRVIMLHKGRLKFS